MDGKRTKTAPPNNADPVAAAVSAALATQQATFQQVVDAQTKAFQACLQTFVNSMNRRFDAFFSETVTNFTELKASLQFAQIELHEIKNEMHQNSNASDEQEQLVVSLAPVDATDDVGGARKVRRKVARAKNTGDARYCVTTFTTVMEVGLWYSAICAKNGFTQNASMKTTKT